MKKKQKVVFVNNKKGELAGRMLFCPACKTGHLFDKRWKFNGNKELPTFTPSMMIKGTVPITDEEHTRIMNGEKITPTPLICHSYVTDGKIQFLSDCTHSLAGKTVDLEDYY